MMEDMQGVGSWQYEFMRIFWGAMTKKFWVYLAAILVRRRPLCRLASQACAGGLSQQLPSSAALVKTWHVRS
jgi:hypothetical protein